MKVRGSKYPLFVLCPSSQDECMAPAGGRTAEAALGTAVHELLAKGGGNIKKVCERLSVDPEEAEFLFRSGQEIREKLTEFTNSRAEVPLDSDLVKGTVDLLKIKDDTACLLDWKSGHKQTSAREQLFSYSYAIKISYPNIEKVRAHCAWLRTKEIEEYEFDDEDFKYFAKRHEDLEKQIKKIYCPGEHCGFCPARNSCLAKREFAKTAALVLSDEAKELSPQDMANMYPKAVMLEKMLKDFKSAFKSMLTDGPVATDEGTEYALVEVAKTEIDVKPAWFALKKLGFTDSDISECISMSVTSVKKTAGKKAAKGQKLKRQAAVMEKLEKAGALRRKAYNKIQTRKKK